MEREGLQDNNGSPMGYGQPGKKNWKNKRTMQKVVMSPEAEQYARMHGNPQVDLPQGQPPAPTGTPQAWNRYGSEGPGGITGRNDQLGQGGIGQMQTQPVEKPAPMIGGTMGGQPSFFQQLANKKGAMSSGYNFGGDSTGYKSPDMTPKPSGLHDAFMQSVQNGYTDIQGTDPFQTGQYMNQLSGFNTNGWGSGERGTGTLKNKFGQIASNYDVTQKGALSQLLQDPRMIEMTGGKATIVPHANQDLLDLDGPDGPMQPIDVIQSATEGGAGQAWAWMPQDEQAQMMPQQDWWQGSTQGMVGPNAPGNQIYNDALGLNQGQLQSNGMDFLQWLLSQQQNGQLLNGGIGNSPVTF